MADPWADLRRRRDALDAAKNAKRIDRVREIPLTHGYVALVNEADYEALAAFRWHAYTWWSDAIGTTPYAVRTGPRLQGEDGKSHRTTVQMHRQILGVPKGQWIDHIDGDGLNNTRVNLRLATPSQNQANRTARSKTASGMKGVRFNAKSGRWLASIKLSGRATHLGSFSDRVDAARAYDAVALETWGEFARLNCTTQH